MQLTNRLSQKQVKKNIEEDVQPEDVQPESVQPESVQLEDSEVEGSEGEGAAEPSEGPVQIDIEGADGLTPEEFASQLRLTADFQRI